MVRGKMGCSAVYVLRDADAPGRYCWVTLWVSRKAFVVASQSSDWNDLGARCSFTLLCGYGAAHFASPSAGRALDAICRAHSRVRADAADPLGAWLIATDSPDSIPHLQGSAAR